MRYTSPAATLLSRVQPAVCFEAMYVEKLYRVLVAVMYEGWFVNLLRRCCGDMTHFDMSIWAFEKVSCAFLGAQPQL